MFQGRRFEGGGGTGRNPIKHTCGTYCDLLLLYWKHECLVSSHNTGVSGTIHGGSD